MPNDRDTHFLGFAELLASEIEALDNLSVPGSDDMPISYGHWKEYVRKLIAQRAYDLVEHTLRYTIEEIEHTPEDVPDLTQWSESSTD